MAVMTISSLDLFISFLQLNNIQYGVHCTEKRGKKPNQTNIKKKKTKKRQKLTKNKRNIKAKKKWIDRRELRNRQRCLSAISDSIDTDPRLSLNVDVSKTYHCPSKVTTGTKYPKNQPKTQSPSQLWVSVATYQDRRRENRQNNNKNP